MGLVEIEHPMTFYLTYRKINYTEGSLDLVTKRNFHDWFTTKGTSLGKL